MKFFLFCCLRSIFTFCPYFPPFQSQDPSTLPPQTTNRLLKPFLIWLELKRKRDLFVFWYRAQFLQRNSHSPFPTCCSFQLQPLYQYIFKVCEALFLPTFFLVLRWWSTKAFFNLKYFLHLLWLLVLLFWSIGSFWFWSKIPLLHSILILASSSRKSINFKFMFML